MSRQALKESEQQLRDYLGGYGFQGDQVTDPTARFSGGEKARLVLALIIWQRLTYCCSMSQPTTLILICVRR